MESGFTHRNMDGPSSEPTLAQATIGIVTALPLEFAAALLAFSPTARTAGPSSLVYELSIVPCIDGEVVVAITLLHGMGNNLAAAVTTRMLQDCRNIRDVVMVGIAGAIPCPTDSRRHVRLGDIVVSGMQGVFQFDLGKKESGSPFSPRASPTRPSALLGSAVARLESSAELGKYPWETHLASLTAQFPVWCRPDPSTDVLDDGNGIIPHPPDTMRREGCPRLFVGAIASSNTLLKDAAQRDALAGAVPLGVSKLLCCVEMEGAGVQDAAWLGGESSLVVRGTCDYCNEKKDDRWQKYAALIAATFARSVVEALPAPSSSAAVEMPPCSPSGIGQSFGRISITGPVTILNTSSDVYLVIGGEDSLSAYARNSVEFVTVPDLPREVTKPMIVGGQFKETLARLVADMRRDLSAWRYEQAERAAETLDRLLSVHEADLSDDDVRSGAILVARVYINRAEGTVGKKERSLHRARALLERIERNVAGLNADIIAEVTALKASLESLAVGPDAALELIEGRTDPYAIRTRVALFLKQRKVFEAVQALAGLDPHERWCDVAVAAYVLNGEVEKANCLMHWAADLPDRTRHAQCVLMQADALMGQALAGHQEGESILPHDVSMQEREALQGVLEVLGPVLRAIGTAGGPRSGIDVAALRIAWHANHLLERTETVAALLGLLGKWEPVPVDVARGVVGGYIEAPASLPDRLVRDHPGDLDAGILAAVIQSVSLGQHKEAFAKAKELLPLADSDEKKEELSRVLQQVWQNLEGPEMAECETLAESLVLHNPRLQAIFGGLVALRSGDADRAISALDGQKSEDDPYWLQVRGNALLQKQQAAEAVDFLLVAAKKTRAPGLLQRTSDIAFQAGRHDVAVWCNETLAEIQPRNLPVRHNLAHIYTFVLHDMERAAVQFKALSELEPQNSIHTLNLAVCLAQLFRPEESLGLYESLCAHENPTLQAVLGRAQLHHSMGRPDAALASLETFRERFWGEPDFLLAYMATAHAAGNNEAAHEALMALNQLREAGRLGSETLRVLHQDEGLEIIKQSFREGQERTDKFHAEMLKGRMPWVWAEQMSRTAIYWGWRTRTQEMGWIGDDPTNRARFSIYSTNGFHARESERGRRELMPLECPAPGTRVVADVSALITLHRLGLLDEAAQYFDEILVPAGYLPTVLEDSRQMVLGQRSQRQEAEQIVKAVNIGQIVTIAEGSETAAATPIADEYVEVAAHRYRLTDVVRPLYAAGLLSEVVFSRVSHVCTKPSAVDETHPALSQFKDLMVDLATLETIAQVGLLDAVAGFYGLQITAQAHREVIQRLNAIEYQEETRGWHIDLWSRLRRDARFKFVPHTVPEELRGKDKELKEYLPFLSCFIALQTKTPLMADDRTCQAFTLNGMADVSNAAFGSDVVILALMTGGRLDAGRAAVAIRRLMAWRYRFIVPPPEILKALADEYRGNSPGEALREIAEYVHDCMRDTGLFGGRENTAIGDSMAMRCYLAWIRNIAEFLVLIWADEGYAPESAAHLTEWSCREFLPSCPRVMEAHGRVEVTSLTPRLFLSHALLNMVNRNGGQRFADAMKEMKEALRLTDDEYTRIITGILQDAARTAHQS